MIQSLKQRIAKLENDPAFNWRAYFASLTDKLMNCRFILTFLMEMYRQLIYFCEAAFAAFLIASHSSIEPPGPRRARTL